MQLRGLRLEQYLEVRLMSLIEGEAASGRIYTYTQSGFARDANVSRETIRKKQCFLDSVLKRYETERRQSDGGREVYLLREKVQKLQFELEVSRVKYNSLRAQHVKIFEAIYYSSADLGSLIFELENIGFTKLNFSLIVK